MQGEIADEFKARQSAESSEEPSSVEELYQLAAEIVPYCLSHNAEADACDLLMEVCKGGGGNWKGTKGWDTASLLCCKLIVVAYRLSAWTCWKARLTKLATNVFVSTS